MRLLNARTKELALWDEKTPYAIVSHRWGAESDEVQFTDINDLCRAQRKVKGYKKIDASCSMALDDGLAYVWIDTCCIDRRNEKELTAAINSMFAWYHGSKICYAYLHDVNDISELTKSEWFLRGWTLQELIAPRVLKFFAKDWTFLGTREELIHLITKCTGIKSEILVSDMTPHDVSIAQRMYWARSRATTEEEDRAYSLLGLFDLYLPAIYGIKQKAFQELQLRIMSKFPDKSLFAWEHIANATVDPSSSSCITGLLAASPSQYLDAYEIPCKQFYRPFGSKRLSRWECFSLKNGAVCVTLPIRQIEDTSVHAALLRCSLDSPQDPPQCQRPLVVYLKQDNRHDRFVRVHTPTSLCPLQDDSTTSFTLEKVYVDEVYRPASRTPESRAQTLLPLPQTTDPCPSPILLNTRSYERTTDMTVGGKGAPLPIPDLLHPDTGVTPTAGAAEEIRNHPVISTKMVPETTNSSVHSAMRVSDATDPEDWTAVPPFRRFLVRHPPGSKTVNIIVCGEPGAGAGGVVNLVAGRDIVDSQTEFKCSPMTFTAHDISLDSRNMRIFYAIGPQDHRLDMEGYHAATENAKHLAQSLRNDGGVHLLLCCVLRTKPNRNIHRLFYETLCNQSVPVIVLVTGFTSLGESLQVDLTGIRYDVHASISVVRPHTPEKSDDYECSVKTVQKVIVEHTQAGGSRQAYFPHVGPSMCLVLKGFMSASAKRALALQLSIESMHTSGSRVSLAGLASCEGDLVDRQDAKAKLT